MSEHSSPRRPHLQVNVIPTAEAAKNLTTALRLFRADQHEPLVFGDDNKPEAAIIPFADLMHFLALKQDADEAEERFQGELHRRVESGARLQAQSVEDFARSLGGAATQWADEQDRDDG